MKRVLFVPGFKLESTKPNPICEKRILDVWRDNSDFVIDVVCNGTVDETELLDWKKHPLFMVKRMLMWPVVNPNAAKKCYLELRQYLKQNQCDCIFVSHKPYEVIWAVRKIKSEFPNVRVLFYELDPIANEIDANNGIGKYLFFLTRIAEKKAFSAFDVVFHMNCNKDKYSARKYKRYQDKFVYLDFPLVEACETEVEHHNRSDLTSITLLYAGALDDVYRSPDYLLTLLDIISKRIPLVINFFAQGNSVKKIEELESHNPAFHSYGYVNRDILQRYIDEADFLINIGNKYSTMLPSKVLTYINNGKPILHIQNQSNDAAISYLKRYGLSQIVNESIPIDENVDRVVQFLLDMKGKKKSWSEIREEFIENTPEWSEQQIIKYV